MKTPEEIKANLKEMARYWRGWNEEEWSNDALTYIEQLEEQLSKQNNLIDVLEEENDEKT